MWRGLFNKFKSSRIFIATKAGLPERFKIWRGGSANGLSWTTDESIARWFANRFGAGAEVHCRETTRDHAVCYLTGRNEKEVILL